MKNKKYILILFTLTLINTIIAGFWILDIKEKTELFVQKKENIQDMEMDLYERLSLDTAISELSREIAGKEALYRSVSAEYNSLEMTEDVLFVFSTNRIKIISYRLEGEENRQELALTAEGEIGNILKLIYDISFSKKWFRIIFINVDAKLPGKPASLVMRITYA